VIGFFGSSWRIFQVFLLMSGRNIRSIEQLKNVRFREAGIVLGFSQIPSLPKVREWFYIVASKRKSMELLYNYFRYQIRAGLVSSLLWFTDGHLLPYTGKAKVHYAYNTQRRMPVPGRTNLVTCDLSGRIVDFEIQEGKGDLCSRILDLAHKWEPELSERPVSIFDREGHGAPFFSSLVKSKTPFVTWDKHVNTSQLESIPDADFIEHFEFNDKEYSVFEKDKAFIYKPDEVEVKGKLKSHSFTLRHIFLWNRSSQHRTCGLAWDASRSLSLKECTKAILSRWGASENTFKHLQARHPLHYQPGFELIQSEQQEIANPAIKEQQGLISRLRKQLDRLRIKLGQTLESLKKDGTPRRNSARTQLEKSIEEHKISLNQARDVKKQLPGRVDVSTLENYRSFQRVDNEGKNIFDFVTTSVWNARKEMVDWLRRYFDNENELVDFFYAITESHGWVRSTNEMVTVRLEPLQQPRRRAAQRQLCRKLTGLFSQTPSGKWLIIEVGESPLKLG
jgi:hypothetical protein